MNVRASASVQVANSRLGALGILAYRHGLPATSPSRSAWLNAADSARSIARTVRAARAFPPRERPWASAQSRSASMSALVMDCARRGPSRSRGMRRQSE